jgi:Na+-transporting methylmalonyl-CoA/oxaloacetate decarboxylase gamma subunit
MRSSPFLLAWNIALSFAVYVLLSDHQFVDQALYDEVKTAEGKNSLSIAIELGRLDFASSLIALVGILVGIGALFGYFEVRSRAASEAREAAIPVATEEAKRAAQIEAAKVAERVANEIIPPVAARSIRNYLNARMSLGEDDISDSEIKEIMQNLDGEDDGNR